MKGMTQAPTAIMFVNVAINAGSGETYTYSVPPDKIPAIAPGKRVLVPFGRRRLTGCVVEVINQSPRENIKDILDILDEEPLFEERDLAFYRWASQYYLYPLGKALSSILPSGIEVKSSRWIMIAPGDLREDLSLLTGNQRTLLDSLKNLPRGCAIQSLKRTLGRPSLEKNLRNLADRGFVIIEDRLPLPKVRTKKETILRKATDPPASVKLTEKQRSIMFLIDAHPECTLSFLRTRVKNAAASIRTLEKKNILITEKRECYRNPEPFPAFYSPPDSIVLNEDQERALQAVNHEIDHKRYAPFLLHGVTGSGKTEVYLRAIEKTLASGGNALLMVPEIALTGQLLSRVRNLFDDSLLALFHSGISEAERYDQWRRAQRGDARILVGTRSSLFVPIRNLRLIIVDEEHDASYKQDDRMPYNARDLAIVKARLHSSVVILGSATPDVQTYHNTLQRGFVYLPLPKRVENRRLPVIHIIDMKQPEVRRGKDLLLSKPLLSALEQTLKAGKQSLLLLNRRGFTTFLYCLECGHVFTCRNCSVTMTHHMNLNQLKCHYCDYAIKAPPLCPNCRGQKIHSFGAGTEKLFQEVQALFPSARIERLDSDIASKRGTYERVLTGLDRREIDILVGTQMIAKGHDFPHVTLVGVVSADSSLNIPDFRASERTFQILTQVSGRGGRGDSPGTVLIQTLNPENPAVVRARNHDYPGFYQDEVETRRDLGFPPFSRLINLRISSRSERKAAELARTLADAAKKYIRSVGGKGGISLLGPAEAPVARIRGAYRWQLLLKGNDVGMLHELAHALQRGAGRTAPDIKIDVDPLSFM